MIKIIESKLLVEKELDDILRGRMWPKRETIFDPVVKYETVVKYLASYNIDIENTTFTKTDPSALKKDQDILFIFALQTERYNIKTEKYEPILYYRTCLYKHGEKYIATKLEKWNTFIDSRGNQLSVGNKDLSNASFSFLVKNCYAAYVLDLKDSRQKQIDRRDARSGSVDRIDPDTDLGDLTLSVDKSGYVVDKNKYRKMLLAVNRGHYVKIFDDYLNLYNEVLKFLNSIQSDPEKGSRLSSTDQQELAYFVNGTQDTLTNFDKAFKTNDQQGIFFYCSLIKRHLNKYGNTIRGIINK